MHNNFEVLQSKCKKYHIKKMIKIALPVGLLLIILVVSLFFLLDNKEEIREIKKPSIKKEKIIISKPKPKPVEEKTEIIEVVEEPDIFEEPKAVTSIEDVEYKLHLYSYNLLDKKHSKTTHTVHKPKRVSAKIESEAVKKPKNSSFSMVLKSLNSIDEMIKVYDNEKSYPLALKIAKQFYKKKDYKKALQWSKQANNLDARAEEAWLVYAKSEYALGHKKRAKGVLKAYINSSNSKEAKSLLISWIKGN